MVRMLFNKFKLKQFFFFVLLCCSSTFLFAHSPTSSTTLLIKGENNKWMLQIRAALTAFEQEVHFRYGQDSYESPEEFIDLIKTILVEDLNLGFSNLDAFELENPQVGLGHETVVFYQFEGPDKIASFTLNNSIFQHIYNSQNTFFLIDDRYEKEQFTLNKKTNFLLRLKADKNKLVVEKEATINSEEKTPISTIIILIIASLCFFIVLYIFIKI